MPDGLEFEIYSNEKCSLPAYIALLYDDNKGDIRIAYDCQTKIINEDDVNVFHVNYLYIISQIIDNPNAKPSIASGIFLINPNGLYISYNPPKIRNATA